MPLVSSDTMVWSELNCLGLLAVLAIATAVVAALLFSIVRPSLSVWPSPRRDRPAWRARHVVHRVTGALVVLAGLGVLGLALFDRGSLGLPIGPAQLVGALLLAFGAVFGLWGYVRLGPAASQGASVPLVSSGPYRYSRNPQYVGAIAVLLGFGLLCSSKLGLVAGATLSLWFLIAPFAEEPRLSEQLGPSYDDYLRSTPRFLGIPERR